MKLGFVTAIVPELSLEEVLRFARDHGYSCVEVMCWPQGKAERKFAGVTHIDVTTLNKGRVDEIHGLCTNYGVSLSGLGYYPNPLDSGAEHRHFATNQARFAFCKSDDTLRAAGERMAKLKA